MAGIKLNPKPQKLQLDNAAMVEEFFENVQMLSVICPFEAYHLAWHLNRNFPVEFVRHEQQDIHYGGNIFIAYKYIDDVNHIEHTLIATRCKTHFLLPELRNFDFIWMIQGGHLVDGLIRDIPVLIKKIKGVTDCRKILHQNLSQRQVFLL